MIVAEMLGVILQEKELNLHAIFSAIKRITSSIKCFSCSSYLYGCTVLQKYIKMLMSLY